VYVCGVFREREKKKKIFCNETCAAAAGKNLGELIEFNLV
jgi:hypothetical protein